MMRSSSRTSVGAVAILLAMATTSEASLQARGTNPVTQLIEESNKQQAKVKDLGEKLKKAGEAYRDAEKKKPPPPEFATLKKAFEDGKAEYDKELAKERDIIKKLDEAAKQGGED